MRGAFSSIRLDYSEIYDAFESLEILLEPELDLLLLLKVCF